MMYAIRRRRGYETSRIRTYVHVYTAITVVVAVFVAAVNIDSCTTYDTFIPGRYSKIGMHNGKWMKNVNYGLRALHGKMNLR